MRRLAYSATLALVSLLLLVPVAGAQTEGQGEVLATPLPEVRSVFIEDDRFAPADAVVRPGTTVLWSNQGSEPHTVTADDGSFDSGVLNPGDAFLVTFEGSGTLTYHSQMRPEMVGSVTVGALEGGDGNTGGAGATEETPIAEQAPPTAEIPPIEEVIAAEEMRPVAEGTPIEEASATEEMPLSSRGQ